MRAAALLFVALAANAEPPITQAEAVRFHKDGLCAMSEPGNGITRADGKGWIVSSLPGKHVMTGVRGRMVIDFTPGKPVWIEASGPVSWCPQFKPFGRDACGPVPPAFLYDARTAGS